MSETLNAHFENREPDGNVEEKMNCIAEQIFPEFREHFKTQCAEILANTTPENEVAVATHLDTLALGLEIQAQKAEDKKAEFFAGLTSANDDDIFSEAA